MIVHEYNDKVILGSCYASILVEIIRIVQMRKLIFDDVNVGKGDLAFYVFSTVIDVSNYRNIKQNSI